MAFALTALIFLKAKKRLKNFFREVQGVKKSDEQCRKLLSKFKRMQMDSEIGLTKCPRCGRNAMRSDIVLNALSRHIDVYICSERGIEEAMLDLDGKAFP